MKRNGYKLKDENLSQKMILNYESGVIPKRVMGTKVTGTFSIILEKSCDRAKSLSVLWSGAPLPVCAYRVCSL